MRKKNVKTGYSKMMIALSAVLTVSLLIITGALQRTFGLPNVPTILSFLQGNPVYEISVDMGTAPDLLELPASLPALVQIQSDDDADEEVEEAEDAEDADEDAGDDSSEDTGSGSSAREAADSDGEKRKSGTRSEKSSIVETVQDVPVAWYGTYDANTPGEYIFTARLEGYEYEGEMPTAVITVLPPDDFESADAPDAEDAASMDDLEADAPEYEGDMPMRASAGRGFDAKSIETAAKLEGLKKYDDIVIDSERWIVVDKDESSKAVFLVLAGATNQGYFNDTGNKTSKYEGSASQDSLTSEFSTWRSSLKPLALIPNLNGSGSGSNTLHTSTNAKSTLKKPLALASSTGQEKDIFFLLSYRDMYDWNGGNPDNIKDQVRKWFSQNGDGAHVFLRTKGGSDLHAWEFRNLAGNPGRLADSLHVFAQYGSRNPGVWVLYGIENSVTVHCIDTDGNAINPAGYPLKYDVFYDDTFTLADEDIPAVPGYAFTQKWRQDTASSADKDAPVEINNVTSDADIYLIYDTAAPVTVTVHYLDIAGDRKLMEPDTYPVQQGGGFELESAPWISGFLFTGEWKEGSLSAQEKDTKVEIANVPADTDIYLYYRQYTLPPDIGESEVYVSKTASSAGLENVYDITLETITTYDIVGTGLSGDAAVVLVIDLSGSMGLTPAGNNADYDNAKRLHFAKQAANSFLDNYASNADGDKRMVSIVAFNNTAWVAKDWTDATASLGELKSTVNGLSYKGGTFMQGGLLLARNLYNSDNYGNKLDSNGGGLIANRYVILLTDGNPTFMCGTNVYGNRYGPKNDYSSTASFSPTDYSWDSKPWGEDKATNQETIGYSRVAAESVAAEIKNGGGASGSDAKYKDAVLFTVAFGMDGNSFPSGDGVKRDGTNWLKARVAQSGEHAFSTRDGGELNAAFDDIFESINKKVTRWTEAWIINDPMAQHIQWDGVHNERPGAPGWDSTKSFDGSTDTLTWDIKQSAPNDVYQVDDVTYYLYTYTYRIRLDNLTGQTAGTGYVAGTEIPTNGKTYLIYYDSVKDDFFEKEFAVPKITGKAADFGFIKQGDIGSLLDGVKFRLRVDGSETLFDIEVTSKPGGITDFGKLPSGHTYTLTEVSTVDGYVLDEGEYTIEVSDGRVTVSPDSGALKQLSDGTYVFINQHIYVPPTGVDGSDAGIAALLAAGAALFTGIALFECKRKKAANR